LDEAVQSGTASRNVRSGHICDSQAERHWHAVQRPDGYEFFLQISIENQLFWVRQRDVIISPLEFGSDDDLQ
jgi:hypothetical protein